MKSVKSNHIENLEKYVYNYYDEIADNYDQIINKHFIVMIELRGC